MSIMYARSIQVQTKVHFKILQFLVVTYNMRFLPYAIDIVYYHIFKTFFVVITQSLHM